MTPCLNSSSCCSKQVEIIRSCCSKHLSCNATLPGPSAGTFQRLEPAENKKYRVFCHSAGAAGPPSRPRADRGIPGLVVINCGAPGVFPHGEYFVAGGLVSHRHVPSTYFRKWRLGRSPHRNGRHMQRPKEVITDFVSSGHFTTTVNPPDVLHPDRWGSPIQATFRMDRHFGGVQP